MSPLRRTCSLIALLVAGAATLAVAASAAAETIALIGTGNVGSALGRRFAERIARLAPGAQVVKAFSTLGAETMYDPRLAEGPVTIPIVGDDRAAKDVVATLAREIGLEAVDVGPLRHARIIEGLHYLRANALGGRVNFHFPRDHARD